MSKKVKVNIVGDAVDADTLNDCVKFVQMIRKYFEENEIDIAFQMEMLTSARLTFQMKFLKDLKDAGYPKMGNIIRDIQSINLKAVARSNEFLEKEFS